MTDLLVRDDTWAPVGPALAGLRRPAVREGLLHVVVDAMTQLDRGASRVVVGARRMFCFVELLRDLGAPIPVDRFVSDRFLELLPDGAWAGEWVHHIDDTVVSGLTLQRNLAILARLTGPAGTVTQAVGIPLGEADRAPEWDGVIAPADVPQREHQLRRVADGDLHQQFAATFGANLVPYFADFAVTRPETVALEVLDTLLRAPWWQVAEVTNAAVSGSGARAFSCFLGEPWLAAFRATLGPDLGSAVEVAKMRVFIRETADRVQLRLVPIVLTVPLEDSALNGAAPDVERGSEPRVIEALGGLLSFELSMALLQFLVSEIEEATGWTPVVDDDFVHLVLGELEPGDLGRWSRVIARDRGEDRGLSSWVTGVADRVVLVGDDLVRPLVETVHEAKRTTPRGSRLGLGSLATTLGLSTADLSLALDVGNDLGFVVPTQVEQGGVVERGYRAGELDPLTSLQPGPGGGTLAAVPHTLLLDADWIPIEDVDGQGR